MSQAHIPQPNANAPGEQIASTDSVPPMVSIETPQPSNSQEIVSAVGEMNQLDPWFYTQFRQIAKVRWSTSDVAGKILWYVPLNPLALDKNLAYVSQLYLAWDGDFVFNFKVAGTGFHAGMLTFVKTPPTIHPTTLTNPADFTIMPWDAVDPKMLEIGSMYGRDIRTIKYHYMQKNENTPPDYYLGGYLALFVDLPLNTSASGTPRIEVAIWMKCAANFRVGWMLPFDYQKLAPEAIVPPNLGMLLDFSKWIGMNMASYPIDPHNIIIMPETTKVLTTGIYNTYTLEGVGNSKFHADEFQAQNVGIVGQSTGAVDAQPEKNALRGCKPFWQGIPDTDKCMFMSDQAVVIDSLTYAGDGVDLMTGGANITHSSSNQYGLFGSPISVKPSNLADGELTAKTNTESFLVFGATVGNVYSIQTLQLAKLFQTKDLAQWMPAGQAAIFQMVEKNSQLPLTFVKLYRQGFFTAPAVKDQTIFLMDNIEFKFQYFQPDTDAIATPPLMVNNFRIAAHYYGRQFKRQKRAYKASLINLQPRESISDNHGRSNARSDSRSSINSSSDVRRH